MGQIIGYVLVLSISLAVLLPIIIYSQEKIVGTTTSVIDITEQANLRASQNIIPTLIQVNTNTQIHISNIGLVDVVVFAVLIDGVSTPYTITDQQDNIINTILYSVEQIISN